MEIIIENENTQLVEYKINFEEAKKYLQEELNKYQELVVSEEFIQSAKKSRAELNAKKAELKSRLTTVKKKHNEPIDALKSKVDELIGLIDEPLNKIDQQIKAYEQKIKEQKAEMISQIFEENKGNLDVKLETIFNPKWLNTDYSKKKITTEIETFFERCRNDLSVIESFDDEFVIPLKELYMTCFDMSIIMQKKIAYDRSKREKEELERKEQERLQKEKELEEQRLKEKYENQQKEKINNEDFQEIPEIEENFQTLESTQEPTMDFSDSLNTNTYDDEEKCNTSQSDVADEPKQKLERINFWVEVTPEQKLMMREFVIKNKIRCGKLLI